LKLLAALKALEHSTPLSGEQQVMASVEQMGHFNNVKHPMDGVFEPVVAVSQLGGGLMQSRQHSSLLPFFNRSQSSYRQSRRSY
jgi:hypothetical protein